jgi:hypothetical protein
VTSLESLTSKDGRDLARWILDGGAEAAGITGQKALALVSLLTRHLTASPTDFADDEWAGLSHAFSAALRLTPHELSEAVSRRFHLMSVLLRSLPPRRDVPLLDPDGAARMFLDAVPMSRANAVRLSADWRTRDVVEIRQLRRIKNMLTPLLRFSTLIADPGLSARVAEWGALRDRLP